MEDDYDELAELKLKNERLKARKAKEEEIAKLREENWRLEHEKLHNVTSNIKEGFFGFARMVRGAVDNAMKKEKKNENRKKKQKD